MLLQLNTPSFCSPYSQGEVIEFTYILHILTVENEESRGWGEFEYDMGVIQTLRHENYCQFHYQKEKKRKLLIGHHILTSKIVELVGKINLYLFGPKICKILLIRQ